MKVRQKCSRNDDRLDKGVFCFGIVVAVLGFAGAALAVAKGVVLK